MQIENVFVPNGKTTQNLFREFVHFRE